MVNRGIIINDQDAAGGSPSRDQRSRSESYRGQTIGGSRQLDGKRGALAWLAGDGDIATHYLAEPFSESQAQTSAAVTASGGFVSLGKYTEEFGCLFRSHSNAGVTYGKADE